MVQKPIILHDNAMSHTVAVTVLLPGGPVVIIVATGSEVRGFKPGRGR